MEIESVGIIVGIVCLLVGAYYTLVTIFKG